MQESILSASTRQHVLMGVQTTVECNESSERHKVFLSRQTEIQPPFVDVA